MTQAIDVCRRCGREIAWVERSKAWGHRQPQPGRGHYATPAAAAGTPATAAVALIPTAAVGGAAQESRSTPPGVDFPELRRSL